MENKPTTPAKYGPPSDNERIKRESNYLRGTIEESLADPLTADISADDAQLTKFHGSYMQDDRDLRNERRRQKLEPSYSFMVRVRLPGGTATPEQWLTMDRIAHEYGNGTLRLTTRQTFQMHGILKWNMKKNMQAMNEAMLDTIAACGDVNRNVMAAPNPYESEIHEEVQEAAKNISEHLLPQTKAYHEIWLNEEKVADSSEEVEPLYKDVYLPRKFKIGIAVPPSNDIDVFSQDIGLIAIVENNILQGFNIAVGGGLGMTHGETDTYPQLGRVIGFCPVDHIVEAVEKLLTIQRDYGNRSNRKNARFKYTIDTHGLDWLKNELKERLGWDLEEERAYHFDSNGDRYGWMKGSNNRWHLTLFIENGRIKDTEDYQLMTALREIAKVHTGEFRLSPNQNLIIGNVTSQKKKKINELVEQYGLSDGERDSALRRNAMACVAFPTCGLAMAESERYLPSLLEKLEGTMDEAGLRDNEITIRMTGCPNGCARSTLGEIGFIGKGPGKYNLYLGGGFAGERLNKLYRENIGEEEILSILQPMLQEYARERLEGEPFGDYVIRAAYVDAVHDGREFHASS
ncbi:assimilatory sulfite reductase (NADPH) hemoprotein subunit [Salibacterium halotolerans]|uniref:Sulfite reductase [NADPH] hemoprotein beta-component n=1 Tax=Salibacterium halotolerans TaxID=1884432 RepID=A0A1I5QH95_9BACI|nr:assimilatory sulfite reductase (NADPH) hemoprotein subunit [Salibacterium halotolerans]SFP45684.1 sulfite reductase (NADPH) hemoprotein beta-component [Salibacterium halotolerans]